MKAAVGIAGVGMDVLGIVVGIGVGMAVLGIGAVGIAAEGIVGVGLAIVGIEGVGIAIAGIAIVGIGSVGMSPIQSMPLSSASTNWGGMSEKEPNPKIVTGADLQKRSVKFWKKEPHSETQPYVFLHYLSPSLRACLPKLWCDNCKGVPINIQLWLHCILLLKLNLAQKLTNRPQVFLPLVATLACSPGGCIGSTATIVTQ